MEFNVQRRGKFSWVDPMKRQFRLIVGLLCVVVIAVSPAALHISAEIIQKVKAKYGVEASDRLTAWQALVVTNKKLPEKEKLNKVNDFFNQNTLFVDDYDLWGVNDYWATPLQMLARGAGDCEDYSIAKYFTLLELGVPDSKLRLTYVKAVQINQSHMVLTYFKTPRSVPLVLDNLDFDIKLATHRKDLVPVYSFNGSGLWLAKSRGSGKPVGSSSRLKMWTKLKSRMGHDQI